MTLKWALVLALFGCWEIITAAPTDAEIGELDASLEFFEYDMEDKCVSINNVLWDFYRGADPDLNKLMKEEMARAELLKKEVKIDAKFRHVEIPNKEVARKLELLFSFGPALMETPLFEEFTAFAANVQHASVNPSTNLTYQQVQRILRTSNNSTLMAETWSQWTKAVQKITWDETPQHADPVSNATGVNDEAEEREKATADITQQLSLLNIEAHANGAESVEKYWLSLSEVTSIDYDGLSKLWQPIAPLYQRLHRILAAGVTTKHGAQISADPKLIPIHLLGSLDSSDWTTAAESLDVLKQSQTYSALSSAIKTKTFEDAYNAADEITAQLQLGYLPDDFFINSKFEDDRNNCVHFIDATCKSGVTPRVINCNQEPLTLNTFLRAHREVAHIKHHNVASQVDNQMGYFLREGPYDSVLYEAISTATSLMAIHPDNLLRRGLIKSLEKDANITSLLIAALHIIPPLPLHLTYDIWRLRALHAINNQDTLINVPENITKPITTTLSEVETETQHPTTLPNLVTTSNINASFDNLEVYATQTSPKQTYGRENTTADWWSVRREYQGIGAPDNDMYEDYLQNRLVVWNRPHLSKFLGPILLFQILENFKTGNTTENRALLKRLLQKGKSEPWEALVADLFNITELDPQPLLNYFKPLDLFLSDGAKFTDNSARSQFSNDDFKLFLQSTDLEVDGSDKTKEIKSASENSNAVLIVLVGLAVIGSVAAIISVVRRRLLRRRQANDRKRFNEG